MNSSNGGGSPGLPDSQMTEIRVVSGVRRIKAEKSHQGLQEDICRQWWPWTRTGKEGSSTHCSDGFATGGNVCSASLHVMLLPHLQVQWSLNVTPGPTGEAFWGFLAVLNFNIIWGSVSDCIGILSKASHAVLKVVLLVHSTKEGSSL